MKITNVKMMIPIFAVFSFVMLMMISVSIIPDNFNKNENPENNNSKYSKSIDQKCSFGLEINLGNLSAQVPGEDDGSGGACSAIGCTNDSPCQDGSRNCRYSEVCVDCQCKFKRTNGDNGHSRCG